MFLVWLWNLRLLGLENITKIKTRYYKKGLRKRLRIFAGWLYTSRQITVNTAGITPTFTRALPKNLLEISQIVANLWGKVEPENTAFSDPLCGRCGRGTRGSRKGGRRSCQTAADHVWPGKQYAARRSGGCR